jgi:hypothetical protein
MNRIDNNHATFINCLRDWNDPFLHGHGHSLKQQQLIKQFSCQRCESCACRINTSSTQATTNLNDDSYTNNSSSQSSINTLNNHQHNHHSHQQRKYTTRRNSNEINTSDNNHLFQPIVRCKSSINVPKTIDQCIKLNKSRPRPSSIRTNALTCKSSNLTSLPPKKQNISNNLTKSLILNTTTNKKLKTNMKPLEIELKDEEFCKIVLQSSPDTSTSNPSIFAQNTNSFKAFLAKNNQNAADFDFGDLIKMNKPSTLIIDDLSHDLIDIEFIKETENNNTDNNSNNNTDDLNKRSNELNLNLNKYLSASTTLSSTSSNRSAEIIIEQSNNKDTETMLDEEQINQQEINIISPARIEEKINENNQVGSLLTSTSSLIENEEIVYEDSLQDDSFDSDR